MQTANFFFRVREQLRLHITAETFQTDSGKDAFRRTAGAEDHMNTAALNAAVDGRYDIPIGDETDACTGFSGFADDAFMSFTIKDNNGEIRDLTIHRFRHTGQVFSDRCIDINASVTENLTRVAKAMDREISDLTIVVLDRERHEGIIREAREAGARIRLITDGDVVPSIDCGIQGSGIHMVLGSGGAPEGVLAAVGLKCLGGDMQAKLLPHTEEEVRRLHAMGITDPNKVLTLDDLVKGDDCIFSETAITDCAMLKGVRYFGGGARTSTLVLRYKTGTVRFVDTIHRFGEPDKKPAVRLW